MINIGGNIGKLYVGSTGIAEAYVGSQLVYSKEPPPYDAKVEYLQSSGTQYINIDFMPTDLTKTECVFTATLNNRRLYGCRNGANYEVIAYGGSYGIIVRFCNSANKYHKLGSTSPHKVIVSKQRIYIDDWSTTNIKQDSFSTNRDIILFGYTIEDGSASTLSTAAIYSFKLWENDVLMRDLIPVRIGTTGYMYDKVSKRMFGNSGTGSFTLGNDVV